MSAKVSSAVRTVPSSLACRRTASAGLAPSGRAAPARRRAPPGMWPTSAPRMLNVQATEIGIGQDAIIRAGLARRHRPVGQFFAGRPAGEFERMEVDGPGRRWRPVGPDPVDEIVERNELGRPSSPALRRRAFLADGDEPGVEAHLHAGREHCLRAISTAGCRPGCRSRRRRRRSGPSPAACSGRRRTATALVGGNDAEAGRAGEAGQPGQTLGMGRQIFALVLVGMGHEEGVHSFPAHFIAKRGDARCALVRRGFDVVALEHLAPPAGVRPAPLSTVRRGPAASGSGKCGDA